MDKNAIKPHEAKHYLLDKANNQDSKPLFTVYVSNLPINTNEVDIRNLIDNNEKYNINIRVICDKKNQCRGFAYLDCNSAKARKHIIKCLNDAVIHNRKIFASISNPTVQSLYEKNIIYICNIPRILNNGVEINSDYILDKIFDEINKFGIDCKPFFVAIRFGKMDDAFNVFIEFNNDLIVDEILSETTELKFDNSTIYLKRSIPKKQFTKNINKKVKYMNNVVKLATYYLEEKFENLISLIGNYGDIKQIKIFKSVDNLAIIYITFSNELDSNFAASSLDNYIFNDQIISVIPCSDAEYKYIFSTNFAIKKPFKYNILSEYVIESLNNKTSTLFIKSNNDLTTNEKIKAILTNDRMVQEYKYTGRQKNFLFIKCYSVFDAEKLFNYLTSNISNSNIIIQKSNTDLKRNMPSHIKSEPKKKILL